MKVIKLCPFCGGKVKLTKEQWVSVDFCNYLFYEDIIKVQCKSCGASGKKFRISENNYAKEAAIEFWNRRAR